MNDGLVRFGFVAGDPDATPPSAASYRSYAVSFTTGSDAGWYQLSKCLLPPRSPGLPWPGCPSTATTKEVPMPSALYVTHFRGAGQERQICSPGVPGHTPLDPNQTYWAVFEEVSGLGVYEIPLTAPNGDEDPESWPISDTSLQRNFFSLTGRTWQASALNPILMIVHGYRS